MTYTTRTTCQIIPVQCGLGYGVSDDGRVWTTLVRVGLGGRNGTKMVISEHWREVRTYRNHDGYRIVDILGIQKRVHRLVLEAFAGPCPPGMQACHINGVRSDNRISNLRWGTVKANANDREIHGNTARGEKQGSAKIVAATVRSIRAAYDGGSSTRAIAKQHGISQSHVVRILSKKNWKHV